MAEETWVHDGSSWRLVRDLWVRSGTSWREVEEGWLYNGTSWKQVFNYDTTGPSAPTSPSATWGGAGATPFCSVYWVQPNDADFSYTRLERSLDGGASWSFIANYSGNAGVALAYTDYNVTLSAYQVHSAINQASVGHIYRMIPYDTRNNQGTIAYAYSVGQNDPANWRGFIQSPYYRNATGSATWSTNQPVGWIDGVSQGYQSPWNRRRYGHYFYDNTSTFWNFNVTSAEIQLYRKSGSGIGAAGVSAYLHPSSASGVSVFTGANPIGNIQSGASVQGSFGYNQNGWVPFPGGWAYQIMNGTSSSVVLDEETTNTYLDYGYSRHYSQWEVHTYNVFLNIIFSGTLAIYHTG
jgi:hypothetical protein